MGRKEAGDIPVGVAECRSGASELLFMQRERESPQFVTGRRAEGSLEFTHDIGGSTN